jgi:RNA polymerase sigma-70 factor (ECF subfamily)
MDRSGFESALRLHGDRVYNYAVWLLGDSDGAEDVVQESYMRLWRHHASVEEPASRTWLLRTVNRLCVDRFRSQSTRREVELESSEASQTAESGSSISEIERGELQHAIREALAALAPRDRALIVLREMQALTYEEISGILELPISTLKPALCRARERLRNRLTSDGVRP